MRASLEVADIFRSAGPAYRTARAGHLSLHQLRVMSAIELCRTAVMGGHTEACNDCGHWRVAYDSCRNRHCPRCQGAAARAWLAEREADLLPVGYFHVVFTLPAEVADIAFHNKAALYDLLFKAASETMLTIAADARHLGARIGITAVLHTWGSALTHHPHVYMIVPGGGIARDGTRWISVALHPPGRDLEQSTYPVRRHRRYLPLHGLSPRRRQPAADDDYLRRRVHPPLPAPRPATRVPPHPPLRAARQLGAQDQPRASPPVAERGAAAPHRPGRRTD